MIMCLIALRPRNKPLYDTLFHLKYGYVDRKGGFELEFKWVDNSQQDGDIYDFYLNGDAAPLGRFNYLYRAK